MHKFDSEYPIVSTTGPFTPLLKRGPIADKTESRRGMTSMAEG